MNISRFFTVAIYFCVCFIDSLAAEHHYEIVRGAFTWQEAKADAERRGGHLATITSEEEFQRMLALGVFENALWIGGTDSEVEGVWKWVTGESWGYKRWNGGEPNGDQPDNPPGDHSSYLQLVGDGTIWNDAPSGSRMSYLLEFDVAPPRRALATATVVNGFLVAVTITDPGFGYEKPPVVRVFDATGSGATFNVTVADGKVQSISVINAGHDYSDSAVIRIALPDFVPALRIRFSKIKVEMTLEIGERYQLYQSADLQTWSPAGDEFIADAVSKAVEFEVQPTWTYFQLRRLD